MPLFLFYIYACYVSDGGDMVACIMFTGIMATDKTVAGNNNNVMIIIGFVINHNQSPY